MAGFFEFLATFFVFGSIAFWLLLLIVSLVIVWQVEGDEVGGGLAIFTMLIMLAALEYMSDVKALSYIYEHPLEILKWFCVYVIIGIAWSFAKWAWALYKVSEYAQKLYDEFNKESGKKDQSWAMFIKHSFNFRYYAHIYIGGELPPQASYNKKRLVFWAMYWPWSLIWTLLGDWITELFERLIDFLTGLYQRVSNYIFRNIPKTENNAD